MVRRRKCSVRGCDNYADLRYLGKYFCRKCHMEINFAGGNGNFWDKYDPWKEHARTGTE